MPAVDRSKPQYTPMTRDDERATFERWRITGDEQALEALIRSNMAAVVKLAHEFHGWNRWADLQELIQEGRIGLFVAAQRFEPQRGNRFLTYATYWIRASLFAYVYRGPSVVRGPDSPQVRRVFWRIAHTRGELEAQGVDATTEAIADRLMVTPAIVRRGQMRQNMRVVAIDDITDPQKAGLRLPEELKTPSSEELMQNEDEQRRWRATLPKLLRCLDRRERTIIRRRHLQEPTETLQEIGDAMGLSRERVRQLEARALKKLRDAIHPEEEQQ